MQLSSLTGVSPIDGRYARHTEALRPWFSEYALIKHRVLVEVRWLQMLVSPSGLSHLEPLSDSARRALDAIVDEFSIEDAARIKAIESETNHDVKAVEYFLREKVLADDSLAYTSNYIHFACTSEDI
ncbi:MAG: adenylosuccinate lyase, partial [Gammaproteobacteria bacterium]|nr:adenylosuccinate lyase [Gammaproteobacteria bacterium]